MDPLIHPTEGVWQQTAQDCYYQASKSGNLSFGFNFGSGPRFVRVYYSYSYLPSFGLTMQIKSQEALDCIVTRRGLFAKTISDNWNKQKAPKAIQFMMFLGITN